MSSSETPANDGKVKQALGRIDEEEHDTEIEIDKARTVDHSKSNYRHPEVIFLWETIQNAHEAYIHNVDELGVIDERTLEITIAVDTEENIVHEIDNAGGIGGENSTTEEKLLYSYLGFDTPGEEKQEGDTSGGHGRGAATALAMGEDGYYVETRHDDAHVAVTGNMAEAVHTGETRDPTGLLDAQGTHAIIRGVDDEIIEKLTDVESVEEKVVKKFPTLVADDDVEITLEIDGERHEIDGLNIENLAERAELDADYPEELDPIEKGGESRQVKNITLFDARELPDGEEAPWKGMLLMNTDQRGEPELAIKTEYTPHRCRAVSTGDLFGIADVSEFEEYEDSAHDGFSGLSMSETGIADMLREISAQEFNDDVDIRDVQEVARRKINSTFGEDDAFTIGDEDDANAGDKTESGSDGPDGSDDPDGPDAKNEARFYAEADTNGRATAGDDITVRFSLDEDAEGGKLTNISVREILTNDTPVRPEPREIAPGDDETVEFTADKDGRYVAEATLRDADGEKRSEATSFITVGEAPDTEMDAHGGVEFIDECDLMGFGETGRRAMAFEDGENLVLALNTDRPEYKSVMQTPNNQRRANNREGLYYKWGLQAIKDWMIGKRDADEFIDRRKVDTAPEDAIADRVAEHEAELIQTLDGENDVMLA